MEGQIRVILFFACPPRDKWNDPAAWHDIHLGTQGAEAIAFWSMLVASAFVADGIRLAGTPRDRSFSLAFFEVRLPGQLQE